MKNFLSLLALIYALPALASVNGGNGKELGHHHHHHHHKGHKHKKHHNVKKEGAKKGDGKVSPSVTKQAKAFAKVFVNYTDAQAGTHVEGSIVEKMKKLEARLAEKAKAEKAKAKQSKADKDVATSRGHILVNSPLPADFNERFVQAVSQAIGADSRKVKVTDTTALEDNPGVVELAFEAPPMVVKAIENEAADPDSKLSGGNLRPFLVAKEDAEETPSGATKFMVQKQRGAAQKPEASAAVDFSQSGPEQDVTPVQEKGIDIDTSMPYGDLEPFGREDTAQELTESSVRESDEMVDQLERAEVAEEKRAVFRALTRLRGAAITSFDGVARSQTGNIDEYNKIHKWRNTHPLHHLADEESDVSKWAFPDNADF